MGESRPSGRTTTSLSLSHTERWTLHHVLVDRLEEDGRGPAGTASDAVLRGAFETLDTGGNRYSTAELRAMRGLLAQTHHARRWEVDRPRLERLLHRLSVALDTGEARASDREDGL